MQLKKIPFQFCDICKNQKPECIADQIVYNRTYLPCKDFKPNERIIKQKLEEFLNTKT